MWGTYTESMGETLCKRFVMKFICSIQQVPRSTNHINFLQFSGKNNELKNILSTVFFVVVVGGDVSFIVIHRSMLVYGSRLLNYKDESKAKSMANFPSIP